MGYLPPGVPKSKRIFDLILSTAGLVILAPIFAIIAAIIFINQGSPVLFQQMRPGLRGVPFNLYKFRTMKEAIDGQGKQLPDSERITSLGRYLRESSLDELPEIVNVFKGEMSLVGPRPLLIQYLDRYTPEQARRHDVLPGITGWAQINGRNALTWEDKFRLDVWYVEHWSLQLDIHILLETFWKVIKREGISQPGQATAEEFMGSQPTKKS
jgi:lipopolysaccharide/colanic/teichoic acid biosynthesis glycosyltransferase